MINRNLSPFVAKGMFGGPRPRKGNYKLGNLTQNSGGVLGVASKVNGNADTVRKIVK